MKKSLFIGQKVKDEGSKVLFAGVYMFVGNGFSNEKPQISKGLFCSFFFALLSVICALLSHPTKKTPMQEHRSFFCI